MEFTPQSITEAVLNGDTETIVSALEQFGFRKNEAPSSFSSESKRLAVTILNAASAMAYSCHWCENDVVNSITSYIAPVVDIFSFLEFVKIACELSFDSKKCDRLISEKLRTALRENKPSKEALALIEELDDYAAELLALYITDSKEVTALCWEFVVPLLRLMYEIVPDDIFFSYMASNLMPCREEELGKAYRRLVIAPLTKSTTKLNDEELRRAVVDRYGAKDDPSESGAPAKP